MSRTNKKSEFGPTYDPGLAWFFLWNSMNQLEVQGFKELSVRVNCIIEEFAIEDRARQLPKEADANVIPFERRPDYLSHK